MASLQPLGMPPEPAWPPTPFPPPPPPPMPPWPAKPPEPLDVAEVVDDEVPAMGLSMKGSVAHPVVVRPMPVTVKQERSVIRAAGRTKVMASA